METRSSLAQWLHPSELPRFEDIPALKQGWYPPAAHGLSAPTAVVVRPGDVNRLVAIAGWAADRGIRLTAFGGGTAPSARPFAEILVDTTAFDGIDLLESESRVVCGSGVSLVALDDFLAGEGLTHGQRIGSGRLATVGGSVATDAIGAFSGRYGRFRDVVVALEWVDPAGKLQTASFQGDRNALQGIIGSYGCAGIVTRASLRVWPQPEARAWALFRFESRTDALDALRLIYRSDSTPSLARVIHGSTVILAFEGDEMVQAGHYRLAYAVCVHRGGELVGGNDEGEEWWERRERFDAWAGNARPGVWADCRGYWAPWDRVGDVWDALVAAAGDVVESGVPEACHPSPQGVALEFRGAWQTNEDGWRARMRGLALAVEAAGGIPGHFLGGFED